METAVQVPLTALAGPHSQNCQTLHVSQPLFAFAWWTHRQIDVQVHYLQMYFTDGPRNNETDLSLSLDKLCCQSPIPIDWRFLSSCSLLLHRHMASCFYWNRKNWQTRALWFKGQYIIRFPINSELSLYGEIIQSLPVLSVVLGINAKLFSCTFLTFYFGIMSSQQQQPPPIYQPQKPRPGIVNQLKEQLEERTRVLQADIKTQQKELYKIKEKLHTANLQVTEIIQFFLNKMYTHSANLQY